MNTLLTFDLSRSAAVKALVEACDLPSMARSNFFLCVLLILTSYF